MQPKAAKLYVDLEIPQEAKRTPDTTFGEYGSQWIEDCRYSISSKTYFRYKGLFERINMGIGHIPIGKIEPYHITKFLSNLRQYEVNKRTGEKLSEKTILHHYRLISVILRQACRERIISYNPAEKNFVRPPKVTHAEIRILQTDEIKQFVEALNNTSIKWQTAMLILLFTGIRRGELCGLEWQDIDFVNGTLSIIRTSQYLPEIGIFTKETKTSGSCRTFTVSKKLINVLTKYKQWYSENYIIEPKKRLFVQADGSPIHPDSITDWLKKFSKKNLNRPINPHMLRHTYISMMIASGVNIKDVSRRVGHSQLSTTCNVYTHYIAVSDAAETALDQFLVTT